MSFALNAVYNNYLSAYTPKPLTQYDTHKKSELRSVYNSIVKMNKDAPWYLPTTNKDTQQYAVDLKENARELHNTIAQLGGLEEKGLFSKKSAYSSDEDVVTASYIGSQDSEAEVPDLQLEVKSLASSQENLGLFLSDGKISLSPGTYSFDVGINDMNYEFQFTIGEAETNRDVQERLIRLINNSGIGLKASLAESEGRTSLRLTSESTGLSSGKQQIFSVSDNHTSKTAGTVEYFGLDYTSREASNASFLVNGEERTASSNHFTIGKLYEVELKGISEEGKTAQIGLKTDMESLTDNVGQLVGGYNDFIRAASSYLETQSKSRQLVSELKGIAGVYGNSLESLGLTMSEDGTLNMDKDLLLQAATQSEDISETFGTLKSFSASLLRKSNQVSINPMKYVQKTVVAYKNPGHTYVSPYTTSAYSGMMFNSYC
ncbi:MAG: flagellar capping protein [Acetatifactor sp.]